MIKPARLAALVTVLSLVALATVFVMTGYVRAGDNTLKKLDAFTSILSQVSENYVEEVDVDELIDNAIRGMLADLDPYTQYLDEKQYNDLLVGTHGSFGGLGIEIGIRNGVLTVIAPIDGTPAHRIGIVGGDEIVKIEGESTAGITSEEAVRKLRGPKGTKVTITIEREGELEPLDYTITRDIIRITSIPCSFMIRPDVGYIRISQFSENTGRDLKGKIEGLRRKGMESLILDLRYNPGGLLSEAVSVSSKFLDKGKMVVYTGGRRKDQSREYRSDGWVSAEDYPMVVLVNGGSASASEIVAGAVQDWDRGLVMGATTFGKGSVQSVISLRRGGGALKITTARYYTPRGRSIHKEENGSIGRGLMASAAETEPTDEEREVFTTACGREILGGGGIVPDIELETKRLPKIASEMDRAGLFFEYAVSFMAGRGPLPKDFVVTDEMVSEVLERAREKELESDDEETEAHWEEIRSRVQREVARRSWGDEAAIEVVVRSDSQVQQAADLCEGVADMDQLFRRAAQLKATQSVASAEPTEGEDIDTN